MTRPASSLLRRIVPHLAAVLALVLCVRLALWQLERADEKQSLLDQWETAPEGTLEQFGELAHFARAAGSGRFDAERHVLLDNQVRQNHPGVHVFTPFVLENGDLLMVNRGWQPWDRRPGHLPRFDTPAGQLMISGRISEPPRVGFQLGVQEPLDARSWPNLVTYYDTDLLAKALGTTLNDRVLLLDPEHPAHLSGDLWPTVNMGPERHLGYAVQWVSIGSAILFIWALLTYRSWRRS